MTLAELVNILKMRGGFDLVNHQADEKQIRMLGRVPKQMMNSWLVVVHHMLSVSEKSAWNIDVSKQYFLRGGRVIFAWRLIIQADDVESKLEHICNAITNAPRAKHIIEEQPLVGARPDRNSPQHGKGAQGVLGAVVGPMAIAQQQMGGR